MGLGWRLASSGISLPNNVFSWLLSDFTGMRSDHFFSCSRRTPKCGQLMLALNTYSFQTIKLKLAAFLPSAAPTGETLCGAHVFEGFFGLENGRAIPKMSSKVVRQHQNAGSKMRPFSEPSGNVPILRGTKNGFEFRIHFLRPLLTLFFLNSQLQKSDHRFSFCLRCHSIQQHSFLSCCRFMDKDSNNVLWLAIEQMQKDTPATALERPLWRTRFRFCR